MIEHLSAKIDPDILWDPKTNEKRPGIQLSVFAVVKQSKVKNIYLSVTCN